MALTQQYVRPGDNVSAPGQLKVYDSTRRQTRILGPGDRPTIVGRVDTAQGGPGPVPDDDITPNATATQEIEPDAAPVIGQNRVVFVSNGEDLDGDNLIDPILPEDPDFDLWQMIPNSSADPPVEPPQSTQQIKIVDLPGDQREPNFSPGGRLVAYASNETGNWEIYTVEVSTGVIWQITQPPGNKRHPTWSYDGRWLAFESDVNGNQDIYKIRSNGAGDPIRLTTSAQDERRPDWSPVANTILYMADLGSGERIFSIDDNGGAQTQLTNGGGAPADDIDPTWSPNGMSIAFASSRPAPAGSGDTVDDFNIWSVGAAGETSGLTPSLVSYDEPDGTGNQYDDTWPTWSPELEVFFWDVPDDRAQMIYQSQRPDASGSEDDLWITFIEDYTPVQLDELPSVEPRIAQPGQDVVVSVDAFDKDSGINQIFAEFKDPDIKIYQIDVGRSFESNFDGTRYLEIDCQTIDMIELLDDGVAPDETANDGVYTGTWTTPATQRDYIIDVHTTDLSPSGNPFEYDDIYGLSTKTFNPDDRILFVDDYCEGQRFIEESGMNFDWLPTPYPVESYWRYNPGYVPGLEWSIDFDSIAGPFDEEYDVWRIICRGPIPDEILRTYLPTSELQLDPADARANPREAIADREVLVANRMIMWAAPHTGDVWIAEGTIQDAATQAKLQNFLDLGGRLLIGGEDIAFALTLDGKVANAFLRDYLRADYVRDVGGGGFEFLLGGRPNDPIAWDAYAESGRTHYGADVEWPPHWYDEGDNPIELVTPQVPPPSNQPCWCDSAWYSQRPDVIAPIGDTKMYGYENYDGEPAATRYRNAATGSRMAYFAFGFEQIHRRYHSPTNLPDHCQNHRSHLLHNAKCWMRTGAFKGHVVSISEGAQPVTDPNPIVIARQGDREYAVRCQDDGSYIVQGLNPGRYSFEIIRTGFEMDHASWSYVHGGREPVEIDFAIKEAQPGAISGTVTSEVTGEFLSNVEIRAYPVPPPPADEDGDGGNGGNGGTAAVNPAQDGGQYDEDELGDPIGETRSAADGTFTIPDLPPGEYVVIADGSGIGYGSQQVVVEVIPGSTTTVTFALGAADGTLLVHVTDADTGDDIPNATVEVVQDEMQVAEGFTDDTGLVNISLQPGDYQVYAGASGYETAGPEGAQITSLQTTNLAFELEEVPPGSISGKVASATTGDPVGGVTVRVLSGGLVVAETQTSGSLTDPGNGTPPYNYRIDNVPAGTVIVRPIVSGFQPVPAERRVEINTGELTSGVSFQLESLHVFPSGLQLTSVPWDYSYIDPADLLDVPSQDLGIATWEAGTQRYRVYPNAPADRLRLGFGYWLNLDSPADLTEQGNEATSPATIQLLAGWNLIGTPFNESIDFYSVDVVSGSDQVLTVQDALSANILGSGLFAYMLGGYRTISAMNPFVGYWVLANEDCELRIDREADALAVGTAAEAGGIAAPEDGWITQLQTSVGGLQDTSMYVGVSAEASDGFDPGLDQGKPPVPAMGPYIHVSSGQQRAVDIRSSDTPRQTWELSVSTNQVGQPVHLRWPDLSGVPPGVQPILTDTATGQSVHMRTSNRYTFEATAEPRTLQVTTSSTAGRHLVISSATAQQSSTGVNLTYTLSADASVTVDVMNISGRSVRQVVRKDTQTAGQKSLLWDGSNATGARVPNGRYLIRISAQTEDGQETSTITPVHVHR